MTALTLLALSGFGIYSGAARGLITAVLSSDPPPGTTPQAAYMALQRAYYLQRKGQFDAQLLAYNKQIDQNQATIRKLKDDLTHYDDRVKSTIVEEYWKYHSQSG